MPGQDRTIVVGPRDICSYGDVYIEVSLVTVDHAWIPKKPESMTDLNSRYGICLRRFEYEADGKKYIRLGDLSMNEWFEIQEATSDMMREVT